MDTKSPVTIERKLQRVRQIERAMRFSAEAAQSMAGTGASFCEDTEAEFQGRLDAARALLLRAVDELAPKEPGA